MTDLPRPLSQPLPLPEPEDVAFAGTIRLHVDASDVLRRIFRVHEVIPVPGKGVYTLLLPKWLPGYHAPQAPIELLAGLAFEAAGEPLHWSRHPTEVHAFHVSVPDGATEIDARFQFLSPTSSAQGRVVVSPDLLNLEWNCVVLYPAGHFSRRIAVDAKLTLPEGWQLATALPFASQTGDTVQFETIQLDELVDSPVMAGRHYRRIELDDGGVTLNVFADAAHQLAATEEQIAPHRAVVTQADRLFGRRPFDRFEVLLALSDEIGSIGVEHHRSCEIASIGEYFTDWDNSFPRRDSFPHEYIHGWNGKHRRGADSWAPCFYQPIRNSLMWVYEGQTQYWDRVLCARSGLWTREQTLSALADIAATHDMQAGSRWRPVSDTTKDPIIAARAPLPWPSWQRSEDYYTEGALIWLDVDTRIRELTGEARSLDDFAHTFFGAELPVDGITRTYLFDDVVRTLRDIADEDWSAFFVERLHDTRSDAPLAGIKRGGYRLVYRAVPSEMWRAKEQLSGIRSFIYSLGLSVSSDGEVQEVRWESAAFDAAITAGTKLIGVNGLTFTPDALDRAIEEASSDKPIDLLVQAGKYQREVSIDWSEGHRYPVLEPIPGSVRRLDDILAPR
ncbi:M61 family metallopeptidase [Sphingomonas mucosissima]|nr:M61 family metallopeptidase [Sphingomonas mucosissima]